MVSAVSQEAARRLRRKGPYHAPPPAQPLNATVTLRLEDAKAAPEVVLTDTRRDYTWRIAMLPDEQPNAWYAEVMLPMEPTIVRYHFVMGRRKVQEKRQVEGYNRPVYGEWEQRPFSIAVYDPDRMPAEWTRGMVVYQIFPDRFAKAQTDEEARARMKGVYGHEPLFRTWGEIPEAPPLGRDFYGGDLRGVIKKLDYLQELGVECIYFNPIFEAPSNHRYEAIDFMKVDQMLGTEADFDRLIEEAHRRDIKIVLDAVFNHCSSDSIYFDITGQYGDQGATQSRQSPYYRWFRFDKWPDKYDGWIGLGFMPEFVECPEMEAYFLGEGGVTAHWLDRGIDGWRADVPFDNTFEFWQRFRRRVDATKPCAWLISEEWRDATHYLLGDTFSATMNYRFAWAVRGFLATHDLAPSELDDRLQVWMRDTPPDAIHAQMNLLDSHDTDRVLTACGGDRARFLQVIAFQLAYAGAPTIYYGNEAGLEGTFAEDGRRCMPWENMDAELLAYFRRAMNYRRNSRALRVGETETVIIDDAQRVYGFARRAGDEAIYAVFNASADPATMEIPLRDGEGGAWRDVLETHPALEAENGVLTVELAPFGAAWYARG
jgi:cyclomaltodextrinase / maltogenic alpha-amylase / neopullulanase